MNFLPRGFYEYDRELAIAAKLISRAQARSDFNFMCIYFSSGKEKGNYFFCSTSETDPDALRTISYDALSREVGQHIELFHYHDLCHDQLNLLFNRPSMFEKWENDVKSGKYHQ